MQRILLVAVLVGGLAGACGRGRDEASPGRPPAAPVVREDVEGLAFFWFDAEGTTHRAARISDVPLEARQRVLVQSLQPGPGAGAWAFVADLRRPGADGTFPVQVITRDAYSEEVRRRYAAAKPPAPPAPTAPGGTAAPPPAGSRAVEIYLTQGCPHCRRAKEWMTRRGVPFVEHDLEADPAAARWVLEHTGSTAVPVFSVGSRVLTGFSPEALAKAIREELGVELL